MRTRRGIALMTVMTVLMVVFILGSALLSLGVQSGRRAHRDVLRQQALALAEAGVEKAIHVLRTGQSTWRTTGTTETVSGQGSYTMVVADGAGDNAGKIVITSTGAAEGGSQDTRRAVRVVLDLQLEDISIWNNVIFGGVGQAGRSINGNVVIRGNMHLLGDGETFTDLDGDTRWDAGETYTDSNGNGSWDAGEPWSDTDGDGHRDPREAFDDVNGNGTRDPALTVTDLSSELSGDANVGNNYSGMPTEVRDSIPALGTKVFRNESVQTLNAKLRVKHGRVNVSGSASIGAPQATGGSPMVKETLNGVYVSDGFGGNAGASQVYSDNGTAAKYDLESMVSFPTLTAPTVQGGVSYSSYMLYLAAVGMPVLGPLTLTAGGNYGPISDGNGNSLSVVNGVINITGIVFVLGDINLNRDGGNKNMRYSGRGTLVSTGNTYIHTDLLPNTPTFPINHTFGLIARRRIELATGSGDSQLKLTGAFYAQEEIRSVKQNELAGTFVTSYFSMQNVPHMYQVPALPDNLPPGMPGSQRIWVAITRIDSWREVRA